MTLVVCVCPFMHVSVHVLVQCRLRDMSYSAPIMVDIEYIRGQQVGFASIVDHPGNFFIYAVHSACSRCTMRTQ